MPMRRVVDLRVEQVVARRHQLGTDEHGQARRQRRESPCVITRYWTPTTLWSVQYFQVARRPRVLTGHVQRVVVGEVAAPRPVERAR